ASLSDPPAGAGAPAHGGEYSRKQSPPPECPLLHSSSGLAFPYGAMRGTQICRSKVRNPTAPVKSLAREDQRLKPPSTISGDRSPSATRRRLKRLASVEQL